MPESLQSFLTLDLLRQDYPSKSIDQNQARLINMYLEPDQSLGKNKIVAYSMPGLAQFSDTSQANIRDMYELNGVLYVVAGAKFGSVNSAGTFTQLGSDLSTSSGFAKIRSITGGSDTNNQVVIIDGTNGYSYNIDTSTATFPISDADFPDTATDMTTQDDYVIAVVNNSIQFNLGTLADSLTWAALDFASKISFPDNLVACKSFQDKLWLFGDKTTEIWENTGNADFPFQKVSGIVLHTGCAAKRSVVISGESLFFLGQDTGGGYKIIRMNNLVPEQIDITPYATIINNYTTISDCVAYSYKRDGHDFIDWTFPTEARTFTYDVTTGIWLARQSSGTRFLGNCSAFAYNKSLIGDYNSGKIYYQSTDLHQEAGSSFTRTFTSPPLYKDGRRIFIHKLQIDVETNVGSSKTFTLEVSNDGGRSWETIDTYTIPSDSTTQLYTSSLGSAYNWMFRINTTMNAKFALLAVIADIEIGTN